MGEIINYETMEKPIKDIEKIIKDFDSQERLMILNSVRERIGNQLRKQKIQDDIGDNPMMKFANKFIKGQGGDLDG